VSESRVLRVVFGPQREEVTDIQRRLKVRIFVTFIFHRVISMIKSEELDIDGSRNESGI
jgi:hypothetical protein